MLSAVAGSVLAEPDAKACILAHRDELTEQNRTKFARVNPRITTSVVDANKKCWAGRATFAMVQTLARDRHLEAMPALDLLIIDETHHAAAPSYRRVIDRTLVKNPLLKVYGVTATAVRGDGKGLREVFTNVADQITLAELIASGHLVPPRTFVIDVGAQDALKQVHRLANDFDMTEVESILNKTPINEAVIRHWREKAGDRKTIVFCSTVAHAESVQRAFLEAGVGAVLIHGELSDGERKARLQEYESGSAQVVVNVAVLTEGYDYTPTACVVLLRPSSHKSTLTQMIGRGLRIVDPNEHPGVVKADCIVLDFGTATLMHGSLEQEAELDGHEATGPDSHQGLPTMPGHRAARLPRMSSVRLRVDPRGSGRSRAAQRLRHDRDRSAQALELPLVRSLRPRRRPHGHGLRGLGRGLLSRRLLARSRRRKGHSPAPPGRGRSHGFARLGRRLAQRA